MNIFASRQFAMWLMDVEKAWRYCEFERQFALSKEPTDEQIKESLELLNKGEEFCKSVGFNEAATKIALNHLHLSNLPKPDHSSLAAELRNASEAVMAEYWKIKLLLVDVEFSDHVDNESVLGDLVSERFPSAIPDIRESGNCIAAGCYTATVFHLMRVAEYGLRALARDRRIKIPKRSPLDLATWEDIIKELEKAEDNIRCFTKTIAREAQYEFYHGAMMEFKRFKNKFRNMVMHTREMYDAGEASSAFGHVKSFMEILSSAISERRRTPIVWKKDWSK